MPLNGSSLFAPFCRFPPRTPHPCPTQTAAHGTEVSAQKKTKEQGHYCLYSPRAVHVTGW